MVKYLCKCCNYSTDRHNNMNKHNNSKKHAEKSNTENESNPQVIQSNPPLQNDEPNNKCGACGKIFAYKQGLSKHKKSCTGELKTEFIIKEMQMQIEMEKVKNEYAQEKLKNQCMQEKIELLNGFKNIAESTVETSKSSCSALNYIIKYYNNAPCIQHFTKFELLTEGNENYSIAEIAIHKYGRNELCTYISNIIVAEYKTDDPEKQTLWISDVNRLAYMIREVTTNNKVEWFTDKGGIKMSKYIVQPILNHISDDLTRYYNEKLEDLDNDDLESSKKEIRNNMIAAKSITDLIKTNQLNDEIVRYIAKYMHLDRKNDVKAITHVENIENEVTYIDCE